MKYGAGRGLAATICPSFCQILERSGQESAALGGLGPGGPEAGAVVEDLPGAVEVRVGRRVGALQPSSII